MRERLSVTRIGALAAAAGVSVDTLRYYEREGLLPRVDRTAGGFRLYTKEAAERLAFITQARRLGMSLAEIRQLVDPDDGRCQAVRDLMTARLAQIDERLADLTVFRKTLQLAVDRCDRALDRSRNAACPVARRLGSKTTSPDPSPRP